MAFFVIHTSVGRAARRLGFTFAARAEVHTARAAKVPGTSLDKPSSASAQGRHGRLEVADVDREKRCLMELSRPDLDDAARMNFLHVPNVV